MVKLMQLIIVIGLIIFLAMTAGCNMSGINKNVKTTTTTAPDGTVTTVVEDKTKKGADIVAMELQIRQDEARAGVIEAASWLDPHAQTAMTAKGEVFKQAIDSYIEGENVEAQQTGSTVRGGFFTLLGLGVVSAFKTGMENAGGNNSPVTHNQNSRQVMNSENSSASGDGDIGNGLTTSVREVDKNQNFPIQGNETSNFDNNTGDPAAPSIVDPDTVTNDIGLVN